MPLSMVGGFQMSKALPFHLSHFDNTENMGPLPFLIGVYMEGSLNHRSPLQTPNDKRVGLGTLRFHQLAFYEAQTNQLKLGD